MPTTASQLILKELGRLIADACDNGDTATAIAERAGVHRELISGLKNHSYNSSPTLERIQAIVDVLGFELRICRKR